MNQALSSNGYHINQLDRLNKLISLPLKTKWSIMQMLLPPFKMSITEQLAVRLYELKRHLPVHGACLLIHWKEGGGVYKTLIVNTWKTNDYFYWHTNFNQHHSFRCARDTLKNSEAYFNQSVSKDNQTFWNWKLQSHVQFFFKPLW